MADFEPAFKHLMDEEGLTLSNHKHDRGGQTYAGIARKFHPDWIGWKYIDAGDTPQTQLVRDFYHYTFWMPVKGDQIKSQKVATVLFCQFVNMGAPAVKLAQAAAGVVADGKIGPKTLAAINECDESWFLNRYALAMVARYYAIGMKDKTQRVWWPGWFGRALRVAA